MSAAGRAELWAFLDEIDAQREPHDAPTTLAEVEENAAKMGPIVDRFAERAGVDKTELAIVSRDRVAPISLSICHLIAADECSIEQGTLQAAASGWVWGFLMGVLWEQRRQLPPGL